MNNLELHRRAQSLDASDVLAPFRSLFLLDEHLVYLDGNSLGPMLTTLPDRISHTLQEEWARGLIRSWNDADWINLPETVSAKIAPLLGATSDCVTVTDSTSVNVFKCLSAAVMLNKGRKGIVSEAGNFPTDLYMVEGLNALAAQGHELKLATTDDEIVSLIDKDTAVVLLTHVDFRTGRMLDMRGITRHAHEMGALVIWDLAHSAGAVELHLDACNADFAVGCGYKYLNGGPGAPSFVYVNRRHHAKVQQPLTGWFSHRAPFDFEKEYRAETSIKKFLCGTPPVLSMVALDEALNIWEEAEIPAIRAKSLALGDFFLECIEGTGLGEQFAAATPLSHDQRGSQISLSFDGDGYAVMQALIESGIIGDYRDPDILRFGFAPLYNTFDEVSRAVDRLSQIMQSGEWKEKRFGKRKAVT